MAPRGRARGPGAGAGESGSNGGSSGGQGRGGGGRGAAAARGTGVGSRRGGAEAASASSASSAARRRRGARAAATAQPGRAADEPQAAPAGPAPAGPEPALTAVAAEAVLARCMGGVLALAAARGKCEADASELAASVAAQTRGPLADVIRGMAGEGWRPRSRQAEALEALLCALRGASSAGLDLERAVALASSWEAAARPLEPHVFSALATMAFRVNWVRVAPPASAPAPVDALASGHCKRGGAALCGLAPEAKRRRAQGAEGDALVLP